jgi:hypothetical protein
MSAYDRQGRLFEPSRRARLVRLIRRRAERTLPARAEADDRYPVHHDHCFKRIAFDHAVGAQWDTVVERPFYRHAALPQLRRAAHVLREMVDRPGRAVALHRQSLRYRGPR